MGEVAVCCCDDTSVRFSGLDPVGAQAFERKHAQSVEGRPTGELAWRPEARLNRDFLGSFSLYPPDNPGTFIVPSQGKLKNQGALLLSMTFVDKDDNESVRIGVKKLQLRNKQLWASLKIERSQ